jgi:hypothetical protein
MMGFGLYKKLTPSLREPYGFFYIGSAAVQQNKNTTSFIHKIHVDKNRKP